MRKLISTFFLFFIVFSSFAGNISGYIKTTDGIPAEGVHISVKGKNLITTTSKEGYYEFNSLPDGTYTIGVSYGGATQKEKIVTVTDNLSATSILH